MIDIPEALRAKLVKLGQDHTLQFWSELDDAQQQQLLEDLTGVDLEQLSQLFHAPVKEVDWNELSARAKPPKATRLSDRQDKELVAKACALGEESLRNGEVAVVIVAGGQGTRLGFEKPKGLYPIGPVSNRTLFQILFDTVKARSKKYGRSIPVLIMTSPLTHQETLEYVKQQKNFGLPDEDLKLFCQGTMAAVDRETGKLLMDAKHRLALSPDGHGGMLGALDRTGVLKSLNDRGIKYLYYCQIDNPLAQVADPELLGLHRMHESELTTQVVQKVDAVERVGNVVDIDGQLQIIEYSDLPDDVARQVDADRKLKLWAGNIAIHVFNIEFLNRVKDAPSALPFHTANKKVPFVDQEGIRHEPAEPNGLKFERFIFDLLPQAKNALAVEAEKSKAFAPVKNADGAPSDTPALARQAMSDLAKAWLKETGVDTSQLGFLEVDPLLALDAKELQAKMTAPTKLVGDVYLSNDES